MRLRLTLLVAAALVLVAATGAQAAAPVAVTGPVSSLGATSATVTGTVNPGGVATTWYVEYGTSTAYGSKTASSGAGSGTTNVPVSATLSGLAQGTTYHYRVVATSTAGTSRGADGVFTTLAAPGVVTGSATSISASSATLNGSVDPNGRATTWWFEYGTSTSYGSKTATKSAGSGTVAANVSAPISGLTAGRTYHFRLVATSDAGTTHGGDATFATSGAPSVTTEDATSIAPTSARLNGTVTPNGLSTSWYFQYGTSTGYGSKTSTHSAGSGAAPQKASVAVSGLKRATVYHFRLVGSNSAGTTVGGDHTFSTSLPPGVQTGAAQSVGVGGATLTGSVDPKSRSTKWWFEYGTTTRYGTKTAAKNAGSGSGAVAVSLAITGLQAATAYHFRLVASSDAGTAAGADQTFSTQGVTLTTTTREVVYGGRIRLQGSVPTLAPGEQVTVFAQPFGRSSPFSIATVLSGAGGSWTYLARPTIGTLYQAGWQGGTSAPVIIGVHPAISLTRTATGMLTTHVRAARSFAFRVVKLQRRTATGSWVNVRRIRLNGRSSATFSKALLPRGRSVIRIVMSVNQAGVGYLGGKSRAIAVRRA
jgi:hypothetical protein